MIRAICILIVLSIFQGANAQKVDRKTFSRYQWAMSNKESLFSKVDTVRIVKLSGKLKKDRFDFNEDLADYYKSDFIVMKFQTKKKVKFFSISIDTWMVTTKKQKYTWNVNANTQIISFLLNKKVVAKFRVAGRSLSSLKSKMSGQSFRELDEVLLVREL